VAAVHDIYERRTATPFRLRDKGQVEAFFGGLDLVEPGVVWLPQWRREAADPADFADDPQRSGGLAGVGRVH
jgi:hypothetical protein